MKNEIDEYESMFWFNFSIYFLGYASSSSGSGLYSDNSYGDTYGSKYPYSNSYTGSYAGGGAYAGVPVGPYSTPYDFQNQFAQYYNSISELNRKYG